MAFSSDLNWNNKAIKFSQKQADLTRELAKKYGLNVDDVITFQAELGRFINGRIENNFEVIFFAQFGKFLPVMQKKLGDKYDKNYKHGNLDNTGLSTEEEKN